MDQLIEELNDLKLKNESDKLHYDQIEEVSKARSSLNCQLRDKVESNKQAALNLEQYKKESLSSVKLNRVPDNLKETFNSENATLEDKLKIIKMEENLAKDALIKVSDLKPQLNAAKSELALYGRSTGVRLVKPMAPGHISGVVVGKETAVTFDDEAVKGNICDDLWAIIGKVHKC